MKFITVLTAIDNTDGELKQFVGEVITAISWGDAEYQVSLKPYLTLIGILIEERDEDTGERINYEDLN